MAYEYNEEPRSAKRARDDWYRARAKKMAQRRRRILLAAMLAVSLLIIGVVLLRGCRKQPQLAAPETTAPTTTPTLPPATTPTEPETEITLVFGGDVMVTDQTVESGNTGNGYDYTENFQDIAAILAGADGAFVNFEGNLAGAPYGTDSASAPQAMIQALANAGVDFIQTANSCAINNAISGLRSTIDGIRQAGMEPLGTFATEEEREKTQGYTICDIGGIRVALVAFTKGMNGLGLAGHDYSVNLLYKDYTSSYQQIDESTIRTILKSIQAQKPDVVIALLHWGSEYNSIVSTRQENITELMLENGVDAIIGTHSHYVQKIQYDRENGTVVAYSLGDLYGNAEKSGTNYSVLLQLQITRDNLTGQTKITDCQCIPVYLLTPQRDEEAMRVVRLEEAMAQYENHHIDCVGDKAYQNMQAALAKIKSKTGIYE